MRPRRKLWLLIGVGISTNAALVFYGDPLILFLIAYAGLSLAAIGGGVVAVQRVIAGLSSRFTYAPLMVLAGIVRSFYAPLGVILTIGVFASVVALSIPLNVRIQERAATEAKAYPDLVAPLLEQYRQQHGEYPSSLDQLPSRPRVPRLLRSSYGYRSDGVEYSFCFPQPGGLIDSWSYGSRTRKWHLR